MDFCTFRIFSSLQKKTLSPLAATPILPIPSPSTPSSHSFTFCPWICQFWRLLLVESYDVCSFATGLFHFTCCVSCEYYQIEDVSSTPGLLTVFVKNGCWILFFLFLLRWSRGFCLWLYWCGGGGFIDFWMVNTPCIPGINSTQSWCIIIFMRW